MRQLSGKVALVTGAASGIGRETALALAREGVKLIVGDVNEEGLGTIEKELKDVSECLLARRVDVSDRGAMETFAGEVHDVVPALDILMNNAGVGVGGGILDVPLDDWEWIIGINLMGVVHGCHFFVPKMVERGQGGHIVNVSSMLGYWIGPDTISYTTAKHGVFGLSESLREDLQGHHIGVSTICPGIIDTNIIGSTRFRGQEDEEAFRQQVDGVYKKRNYGPDKVAKAVVKAIKRNKRIVPVSPEAASMYYVNRLWPRMSRAIARMTTKSIEGKA